MIGRTSSSEPGRKARMLLIMTVRPPFTLPLIRPDRMSPFSMASSKAIQSAARLAFSRDSLVSPKPFSTDSMVTVTKSPTLTSTSPCKFLNSLMSIRDSDFKPALTMTCLSVIATTSAVITSPWFISCTAEYSSNNWAKFSIFAKSFLRCRGTRGLRLKNTCPPQPDRRCKHIFRRPSGIPSDRVKHESAHYISALFFFIPINYFFYRFVDTHF